MYKNSLLYRLLIWILPVSLGGILIVVGSTYLIARRVIIRELTDGIQSVSNTSALQAGSFFAQRRNDLATIAQSPLFKDHFANAGYGLMEEAEVYRREIARMLLDFSRRAKVYPHLGYLDASGRELCRIRDNRIEDARDPLAPAGLVLALRSLRPGQQYVSGIQRVGWHPAAVIRYGVGIFDEAGAWRGALLFDCSLASIYGNLGRMHIGRSGRSYLTLRSRRLPGSRLELEDERGIVAASAEVPGTPWVIVTAVKHAEFLGPLNSLAAATVLMCLFASLLLVLFITCQARSLLAPLRALVKAANDYALGHLDARVSVERSDETAALGLAFNVMAESLQQRTGDLERRVRELTALQRMNESILARRGKREIARALLEAAVNGLRFERASLFTIAEATQELILDCVYQGGCGRFDDNTARAARIPLGSDNMLAKAAREGAAVAAAPCADILGGAGRSPYPTAASCLVPLIGRDRVLGVVCAEHRFAGPDTAPQANAHPDALRHGGPAGLDAAHIALEGLTLFCAAAGLALENTELWDAIVQSEARYRTAVENSPYAVVGLDQNLLITLWNRRAEALFGYQPTETYGRTLAFLFDAGTYDRLAREVETSGSIRQAEIAGRGRDGQGLNLNLSWSGRAAGPAGAREWFVVMEDETEKKRMRAQLLQAEKLSAVGNLIAGVAHELNNPLAAVTGFAELLQDLPVGPEEREDIRHLYHSAIRCRDIVRGLLTFVRQDRSARRRVPLNELVQATVALIEYRIVKTEGLSLEVSLDPQAPCTAGDFQKLQQILVNLLNNACDALKGRRGPNSIRLRTRQLAQSCALEVEDTGPGVPPALRQRIFEPFYSTKPADSGTGIGLSISAQIIAEHGGCLRCEAGPEGGARFVAELPPCPAGLTAPAPSLQLPARVPGRRVFVVDDEPQLAALMTRLLREDECIAEATIAPEEGLRSIAAGGYDLVIIDLDLGRIKGTDLFHAARGLADPPAFLFVTGDVLNRALAEEVASLKVPILFKPFLRTDFLRLVRSLLGARQRRRAIRRPG